MLDEVLRKHSSDDIQEREEFGKQGKGWPAWAYSLGTCATAVCNRGKSDP